MRLQSSLAGTWRFQLDPDGLARVDQLAPDQDITVPLPWQIEYPALDQYSGYAWYVTTFDLSDEWLRAELLLTFGAVDYWSQVYVNGQCIAEHEGGYMPFSASIKAAAHVGSNQLAVRVYDAVQSNITIARWFDGQTPSDPTQPPFDSHNVPHGKQEWYRNVGGIWQDVTLTALSAAYIEQVHVTPNIHDDTASIRVTLNGAVDTLISTLQVGTLQVRIDAANGTASTPLISGQRDYTLSVQVSDPLLWTPETPHLYTVTATINDTVSDTTHTDPPDEFAVRFGFREITTHEGQLLLNGQPLFLLAALDQDLYPETIYTVPSMDYLRDQFTKAKQLGLNCLRCHIKPPDPRYLDLADEMGLLIWSEIPSWRTFYSKSIAHPESFRLLDSTYQRAEQLLHEMIARDFNHPALIIWTIINEDWGTTLPLENASSAQDRAWVAHMYDLCKQLDPTRLVADNSPCGHAWGPNVHVKTDLDDFHMYFNIPDQAAHFSYALEQFALRPLWTFSSQGDAQRTGHEPLILSEFGNWGLPTLSALRTAEHDPEWFDLGPWWSPWDGEPGWPRGVAERFAALGLDAVWPDYDAFATASQWHQFRAMKFELEIMRRLPTLAGYVITEFTDAYWESNGLLDFNRAPKAYHNEFAMINAPDVLIPELPRYATWDDQPVAVRLYGAHYSATDWIGGGLTWDTAGSADNLSGHLDVSAQKQGTVAEYGTAVCTLPPVERATTSQVILVLRDNTGATIAHNTLDVLTLPNSARQAAYADPVAVLTRRAYLGMEAASDALADADFSSTLSKLGYHSLRQLTPETRVAVTDFPDAALLEWVRAGGDLLFISKGVSPFFWTQGRGGAYSGNWMSSFNWLRPGIYKRLDGVSSPLGLPFANVAPQNVILGVPMHNPAYHADFLAGQLSGWVGHPALHTLQFRYGAGRVVMTTYALKDALQLADPVAIALLHDLVDHLTSQACQPKLIGQR